MRSAFTCNHKCFLVGSHWIHCYIQGVGTSEDWALSFLLPWILLTWLIKDRVTLEAISVAITLAIGCQMVVEGSLRWVARPFRDHGRLQMIANIIGSFWTVQDDRENSANMTGNPIFARWSQSDRKVVTNRSRIFSQSSSLRPVNSRFSTSPAITPRPTFRCNICAFLKFCRVFPKI